MVLYRTRRAPNLLKTGEGVCDGRERAAAPRMTRARRSPLLRRVAAATERFTGRRLRCRRRGRSVPLHARVGRLFVPLIYKGRRMAACLFIYRNDDPGWSAEATNGDQTPATATVPQPHRNRTAAAPQPYRSRTATVPQPHRSRTAAAPQPYRSRTATVPQPHRNRTAAAPQPHASPASFGWVRRKPLGEPIRTPSRASESRAPTAMTRL